MSSQMNKMPYNQKIVLTLSISRTVIKPKDNLKNLKVGADWILIKHLTQFIATNIIHWDLVI